MVVIKGESECEKSCTNFFILQVINKKNVFFIWKWKDLHKLIASYIINNYMNMNEFYINKCLVNRCKKRKNEKESHLT